MKKIAKTATAHCNPQVKPMLNHNDRTNMNAHTINKKYVNRNEYTCTAEDVRKRIDELYKEAETNFYSYCKRKNGISKSSGKPKGLQNFTKKDKSYHEFIYEIKEDTTMAECQALSEEIAKLTGFTPLQIAIHRDETYTNERGEEITHYHAHAVFFTLDKDGLQLARQQASLNKENLSKIQTLASQCLKMPRGQEYFKNNEKSPNYIKDYKVYKQVKEQEKRDKIELLKMESESANRIKEMEAESKNRLLEIESRIKSEEESLKKRCLDFDTERLKYDTWRKDEDKKIKDKHTELESYNTAINEKAKKIQLYGQTIETQKREIENNKKSIKEMRDGIDKREKALLEREATEQKKLLEIESQYNTFKNEIEKMKIQKDTLAQQIKDAKMQLINLEKQKENTEREHSKAFKKLESHYLNKLSWWKNLITAGKHNKKITKEFYIAKDALIDSVNESEKRYTHDKQSLQNKIKNLESNIENRDRTIQNLESELEKRDATIHNLLSTNKQYQNELNQIQSNLKANAPLDLIQKISPRIADNINRQNQADIERQSQEQRRQQKQKTQSNNVGRGR